MAEYVLASWQVDTLNRMSRLVQQHPELRGLIAEWFDVAASIGGVARDTPATLYHNPLDRQAWIDLLPQELSAAEWRLLIYADWMPAAQGLFSVPDPA